MRLGIVLDLDDTLYLEQDYVMSGFRAVDNWLWQNHNVPGFFAIASQKFLNHQRDQVIDSTLAFLKLDPQLKAEVLHIYRTHAPDIKLQEDAESFLKQAYPRYPLYLITDGRLEGQRAKIEALGIAHFFKEIVINGDPAYFKPHHFAFNKIMANAPDDAYLYIADNPHKDFAAPLALGWRPSIRIRRAEGLHVKIATPQNVCEVVSLAKVLDLITGEHSE